MSSTEQIIKDLIERLYRESMSRFDFYVQPNVNNGYLEAEDGTFLGSFSNKFDQNSLFNKFGPYGSKFSNTSIFNKFGQYGSNYSNQSPVNPYTMTPPKIFLQGRYVGRLTTNKYLQDALPTDLFLFYVMAKTNVLQDRLDDFIELISR